MVNTLRVRRAEREISQRDLAAKAGLHPDRYWRIEKGYTDPTAQEQAAIAEALAVPVALAFPEQAQTAVA